MPTHPVTQLDLFNRAVALLGGPRAAARQMNCGEATIYRLMNGRKDLHDGWLADASAALLALADEARALEKRLNPLFEQNRRRDQPTPDGRYHHRQED